MSADACEQCGVPVAQPRNGSRRKRFCSGSCRARYNRSRRPVEAAEAVDRHREQLDDNGDDRLQTLLSLYDRLKADVEQYGTLIVSPTGSVRANPSVEALRRVIVELDRRGAPPQPAEEPADAVDAALRIA